MVSRSTCSAVAAALLSLPAAALGGEEFALKPVLRQGQEFAYILGMSLDVVQKIGPTQAEHTTSLKCSATASFKVVEVAPDGSARLEMTFRKASVQAPLGETQMGFTWPTPTPLPADAPPLTKLGETLDGAVITVAVDPSGTATVTGGLERFSEAAGKVEFPDERFKGFFTPSGLATMIMPIFRADGAGDAPRSMGKGWQTSETVPLPPVGAIGVATDFQLRESDPDAVDYFGNVALTLLRPKDVAADVAEVVLKEGSGGGTKGTFDRRRNLIGYRKSSLTIYTTWKLGEMEVDQSQFSAMTVRLVD